MSFAAEDVAILYADFGVDVCRANGAPAFKALKGVTEEGVFGTGTISEHSIRYPSSVSLFEAEEVVIDGRAFKLPRSAPRRINDGAECVVELIPL